MKIRASHRDLAIILASFFAAGIGVAIDSIWLNFLIASAIYLLLINKVNYKSSLHTMTFIGFTVFIYAPAILNSIYLNTPYFLYYVTAFLVLYFLEQTKECVYKSTGSFKSIYLVLFLLYAILLSIVPLLGNFALYFLSPLIMFYALSLRDGKWLWNLALTCVMSACYAFYMAFGWDGYGRTVVLGVLLTGYLHLMYALGIRFSKFILALFSIAGTALLIGRKNILSSEVDIDSLLNDSAFGPYKLASKFIDDYHFNGIDVDGFFQQVLFSLFSFVPREIWPSKPYGFGFEYVVRNMDAYLIDAGHSIASTLAGDHIYFLGFFGVITAFLMIHLVGRLAILFYRSRYFHGFGVIIVSTNMMVLVWGGMSSFSARIVQPLISLIPIMAMYLIYNKLIKPSMGKPVSPTWP